MRRFLIAIASLAVLPAIAFAQGRGMASGGARPAMAAPAAHMAMHAAPASTPRMTSGIGAHVAPASGYPHYVRTRSGAIVLRMAPRTNAPVRTTSTGRSGQPRSQDIVPGLGFDYAHVAAIHPNGIHGHDRNRGFSAGYFPLFYGGGYYFPLFPDDEDAPPAEAQQVDNGQPEPVHSAAARPGDYEPRQNRSQAAQAPEPEPEPYVFVRRDGTLFFATAYAWENSTLRYITSEGLRRTVTSDKLDLDATQQFNEQRGLTFRAPAA